jgi:flagellar biosynthetic protein FliS
LKPANKLNIYRKTATTTASPGELVLMLYDGALRFMAAAELGFQEEPFARRNEQIHNTNLRAQAIITELQATLNMEKGGAFSENLYRLYDFMQSHLSQANREKNSEKIKVVDSFSIADGKTKSFVSAINAVTNPGKILVVSNSFDDSTYLAGRNVAWAQLVTGSDVNVEQLLLANSVILVGDAVQTLAQRTA